MPRGGSPGRVIGAVAKWRADLPGVFVVAIDGPGGSGKTTIAAAVAAATGAALVHTDDFFMDPPCRPPVPSASTMPSPERSPRSLAGYYDWRRLRAEALEPLRARSGATFRRFDWERGHGLDGAVSVERCDLILVEGVFSAAPELADLVDRAVFVDTPEPERLRRLRRRVAPEEWDEDWLTAERAYFGRARAPSSFDLVVPGTGPPPADVGAVT
jgi:uridine kinase